MSDFAATLEPEPLVRFRDNPLMVAQARRRLRRKQAVPTFIVLGLLAVCSVLYSVLSPDQDAWAGTRNFLFFATGILLYAAGASRVGHAVSEDKHSGLLDFHRATPTTAWTDALGYLVGSAAREYAGFAVLLPFLVLASLASGDSPIALAQGLGVIVLNAWLFHAFTMFAGLVAKKRNTTRYSPLILIGVFFFAGPLAGTAFLLFAHLTPFPAFMALGLIDIRGVEPSLSFFGLPTDPVLYTIVLQATLVAFLVWASARKLARAETPAFSRPGALAFFATMTALLLGPSWVTLTRTDIAGPGAGLFLGITLVLAATLVVALVPTRLRHIRASRRAHRLGAKPGWLEDGATSWPVVPAFFGMQTVAFLAIVLAAQSNGALPDGALGSRVLPLALCGCVAFLAFAAGAVESAQLSGRQTSKSGIFLIGFVTLLLPWIVGAVLGLASGGDVSGYVFALSPLYAAGASAFLLVMEWGIEQPSDALLPQVAISLIVTLAYAAWFHRRAARTRREIRASL